MSYFLQLDKASAVALISAADFATYARSDSTLEASLVAEIIASAMFQAEKFTKRSFLETTWKMLLDDFPAEDVIELPRSPVSAVSSIAYYDTDGVLTTMPSTDYQVDIAREPARIALETGLSWPSVELGKLNAVTISFTAGYGKAAADVPPRLLLAVKFLAEHYYDNRLPKGDDCIPTHVRSMLRRYRVK